MPTASSLRDRPSVVCVRSFGARRKKPAVSSNFAGAQRRPGQLDHGPDHGVGRGLAAVPFDGLVPTRRYGRQHSPARPLKATRGIMIPSEPGPLPPLLPPQELAPPLARGPAFRVDLWIGDSSVRWPRWPSMGLASCRAMARARNLFARWCFGSGGNFFELLLLLRQELVQRRIEEPDGDGGTRPSP